MHRTIETIGILK